MRSPSPTADLTVADLTERELISRIQARLPARPTWMLVGIGDDAAVVEPERNRVEVLSVDALVEGVHFDRRLMPASAIGHRALAVNLSDLAAMGAAPRLALLSFALPAALSCDDFDDLVAGLTDLAATYTTHIAGGNLTRSPGPLVIDITVVGSVKRRQALTRGGARPGDEIYVTGTIGAAAAGLQMLQSEAGTPHSAPRTPHSACTSRYLRPDPRIRVGQLLSRNRVASACVDMSDGLADAVHQVADASHVGMRVDAADVPIDADTQAWFAVRGGDIVDQAITGGDDYELLFTVHPRQRRRLVAVARQSGMTLTRIGVCTEQGPPVIRRVSEGGTIDEPLPRGYTHFR